LDSFEQLPEQAEAKRLLRAALADGPAHAYLLHGPPGVGKRAAARAFAAELIGEPSRVLREAHPDVYALEPVGDQIRIDEIRALRHDLHMRPFEASRRVYLVFGADLLNRDAADALLKDLEEPPPYAVIVLVADDVGPLPPTILSRCQLVPFRRLSERAVRDWLAAQGADEGLARLAAGRLDRAARLIDPAAAERRSTLLEVARAVYADPGFDAGEAARGLMEGVAARGAQAKSDAERENEQRGLEGRDADQRVRRLQRGAERDEVLALLEELETWYRDLIAVGVGAEAAVAHVDRLRQLTEDATADRIDAAERACELVRDTWRSFEEFNISPALALEALLVTLRLELRGASPAAVGSSAGSVPT
jgi:DNA polymerase-3 subunit delta'